MKTFAVLLVCSVVCTLAKPQYGAPQSSQQSSSSYSSGGGSGGAGNAGPSSSGGASSGGPSDSGSSGAGPSNGGNYGPGASSGAGPSNGGNYGPGSSSGPGAGPSNGGGSSGGDNGLGSNSGGSVGGGSDGGASSGGAGGLVTQCTSTGSGDNLKFVCAGIDSKAITLRSEHILWLNSAGGKQQVLDIEVPNYKIDELIQAGFKPAKGGDTKINVLLKKPEQTYEAQTDAPKTSAGQTKVQLQYEQPQKIHVHYPNDKPYTPLSQPIAPPPRK